MTLRWLSVFRRRGCALLLAVASGVLYFVGFCGFDQAYLAWICLVPVLWALDDESLSGGEALLIAWTFGLTTHLGGYTWVVGMLIKFAYLPLPLALLGYFLLCLAQGSLLGVWGYATHRLTKGLGISVTWAAPTAMVVAEWIYPALFPSYLSNSQYRFTWFIQSLDLWGPLGLTFILTLSSAVIHQSLVWAIRRRGPMPAGAWATLAALCTGNLLYGLGAVANVDDTVAHHDRSFKVGVVQANMGIYDKHDMPTEGLRRHRQQSLEVERQGAQVIIWPESGYNYAIHEDVRNVQRRVLGPITTPVIFGGLRVADDAESRNIYNSAFLVDGAGDILGTYDKIVLLAFGEYLPLGETFPWLYKLSPHSSRFSRGQHRRALRWNDVRFGILICYEDILPGFVRQVMNEPETPDVLVNLTNDAWFGDTREPHIHLALAAYRAVEQRRYLVRSTNTGVSAIIDPAGRIVRSTPVFARANLVDTVTPLQGRTLYSRIGDAVGVLCALVVLWWLREGVLAKMRKLRRSKT